MEKVYVARSGQIGQTRAKEVEIHVTVVVLASVILNPRPAILHPNFLPARSMMVMTQHWMLSLHAKASGQTIYSCL